MSEQPVNPNRGAAAEDLTPPEKNTVKKIQQLIGVAWTDWDEPEMKAPTLTFLDSIEAVRNAGAARFRPILLTSLTTFAGLMPMLVETDMQARFLIPMAVSLGFGILFATCITLVLVPSVYMMMEDVKGLFKQKEKEPTS